MKKQHKIQLSSKSPTQKTQKVSQKISLKSDPPHENTQERIRPKLGPLSSPNKQNHFSTANQQREPPLSPVSPLHHNLSNSPHSPLQISQNCLNSPSRTTPLESIDSLRSNKGKQLIREQPFSKILFSGLSKDGRYRLQSHSLEGQDLTRAVEHQKKNTLASILQSQREKDESKVQIFAPARISNKQNGIVKSYAVNTHQGISRGYNQDRVSITLNIKKNGIKAHFFAIYDGHGGSLCCEFLKDSLHQFLIGNASFPSDPKKALTESIIYSEEKFMQYARKNKMKDGQPDKSGSCVLITLIVDDSCYVANVGDSRAILSTEGGRFAFNLSRDHRPSDNRQQQRILSAGGKIYRTQMFRVGEKVNDDRIVGPLRIYPGKLSVSRTLGDIQAKQADLGGRKNVVSCQPEIRKFRLSGKQDFVVLCCDGILQRMESMQVVETAWRGIRGSGSMHERAGGAVDGLIKESMMRKSSDNLTAIIICFSEIGQASYRSPKKSKISCKQIIS